jgi:hypothetical protein
VYAGAPNIFSNDFNLAGIRLHLYTPSRFFVYTAGILFLCSGRRMSARFSQLVDDASPKVPIRIRYLMVYDSVLCSKILNIFGRGGFRDLVKRNGRALWCKVLRVEVVLSWTLHLCTSIKNSFLNRSEGRLRALLAILSHRYTHISPG